MLLSDQATNKEVVVSSSQQIGAFAALFVVIGLAAHMLLDNFSRQPGNFWLGLGILWLIGVILSVVILRKGAPPRHRLRQPA